MHNQISLTCETLLAIFANKWSNAGVQTDMNIQWGLVSENFAAILTWELVCLWLSLILKSRWWLGQWVKLSIDGISGQKQLLGIGQIRRSVHVGCFMRGQLRFLKIVVWIFEKLAMCFTWMKERGQRLQANGRSLVWVRSWLCKFPWLANAFEQWRHWY